MNKERMEELKGALESWGAWSDWNESQRKVLKDFASLIERAEDLEEEKQRLKVWYGAYNRQAKHSQKLSEENQRYEQALEFYADKQAYYYTSEHQSEVMEDFGYTARQALEV